MTYAITPICGDCDPPPFRCDLLPAEPISCGGNLIPLSRKLKFASCAAGLSVNLSSAMCDAGASVEARVRRRGTIPWAIKYPAVSTAYGIATFLFDDKLFSLPCGRYELDIRSNGLSCLKIELDKTQACAVALNGAKVLVYAKPPMAITKPPGATNMFDAITTLDVELCQPLKIGATSIPLNLTDATALCAIVLCKPVHLVLDDGVRRETVMFTGCVSGVAHALRGQAGTQQQDFPKGTCLRFVWDTYNTTTAIAGC